MIPKIEGEVMYILESMDMADDRREPVKEAFAEKSWEGPAALLSTDAEATPKARAAPLISSPAPPVTCSTRPAPLAPPLAAAVSTTSLPCLHAALCPNCQPSFTPPIHLRSSRHCCTPRPNQPAYLRSSPTYQGLPLLSHASFPLPSLSHASFPLPSLSHASFPLPSLSHASFPLPSLSHASFPLPSLSHASFPLPSLSHASFPLPSLSHASFPLPSLSHASFPLPSLSQVPPFQPQAPPHVKAPTANPLVSPPPAPIAPLDTPPSCSSTQSPLYFHCSCCHLMCLSRSRESTYPLPLPLRFNHSISALPPLSTLPPIHNGPSLPSPCPVRWPLLPFPPCTPLSTPDHPPVPSPPPSLPPQLKQRHRTRACLLPDEGTASCPPPSQQILHRVQYQ
ncbi:unnamed protein product [Closterium sp. NIES-54]